MLRFLYCWVESIGSSQISGAEILVEGKLWTVIYWEVELNSGAELERIGAFIHGFHSCDRANSGAELEKIGAFIHGFHSLRRANSGAELERIGAFIHGFHS